MTPNLTEEQQHALEQSHGLVEGPSFVIMSIGVYREMMGLATDDELNASVASLQKSMQEARDGKTRPFTDALNDLGRQHELPR